MPNNKISSSKREIYTKLLDIAEKYTDIKNTDFLKSGLFGYITESMAMLMRDSTIHKSMLYNESFLNTAVLPKSVYNWAKMFNIEVQKAKPKYGEIDIVIPADSISNHLKMALSDKEKDRYRLTEKDIGGAGYIILNKEDPIIAADYYFSLEHSILIKYNIDKNVYTAEYILSEYKSTTFQTLGRPNLVLKNDGTNIIIKARAYQYKRNSFTRQITTTSFLNKIQTFTFEDQFCGAKMFYIENGKTVEVELKYSDMDKGSDSNVAFYNLIDSNTLQINFKIGENYFTPTANSIINVIIYTTKGLDAPISFNGDALMMFSDVDMRTLPLIIQFNPTSLIGGKNSPSISEIKKTIINEISTRNTITTRADLETFFSILTTLTENINNGKITFIKKRDDIIKRMFNAYLLLRDNVDDSSEIEYISSQSLSACIPTNTMNVKLGLSSINSKSEKSFNYNYPIFNSVGENILSTSNTDDYYICPFNIFIATYPTNFVKFIYNLTDDECECTYNYSSTTDSLDADDDFYIIPNKVSIFRGFQDEGYKADNKYYLKINFTTNKPINRVDTISNEGDSGALKYGGTIQLKGTSTLKFSKESIDVESFQTDESGIYSTDITMILHVDDPEFYFTIPNSSSKLQTTELYCNTIHLKSSLDGSSVSFTDKEKFQIDLSEFTINEKPTGIVLDAMKELQLFSQLDNIMESSIIHNESSTEEIYPLALTDVPLVHSSFFNTSLTSGDRRKGFIDQLFTYINLLKENLSRLETSTFFNLKFYNTYGLSNTFNTSNTNIKLALKIHLNSQEYLNNNNLKAEIKTYIRKLIDRMNEETKSFNYSALNSAICSPETYGNYIKYVEFLGLNSSLNQYIEKLNIDEDIYTPEWLNLDASCLLEDSENGIEFIYDN